MRAADLIEDDTAELQRRIGAVPITTVSIVGIEGLAVPRNAQARQDRREARPTRAIGH
jgi:hypothetical protein